MKTVIREIQSMLRAIWKWKMTTIRRSSTEEPPLTPTLWAGRTFRIRLTRWMRIWKVSRWTTSCCSISRFKFKSLSKIQPSWRRPRMSSIEIRRKLTRSMRIWIKEWRPTKRSSWSSSRPRLREILRITTKRLRSSRWRKSNRLRATTISPTSSMPRKRRWINYLMSALGSEKRKE